eukprot:scaffold936_cov173-Ochromonas_danica.AAC.2
MEEVLHSRYPYPSSSSCCSSSSAAVVPGVHEGEVEQRRGSTCRRERLLAAVGHRGPSPLAAHRASPQGDGPPGAGGGVPLPLPPRSARCGWTSERSTP